MKLHKTILDRCDSAIKLYTLAFIKDTSNKRTLHAGFVGGALIGYHIAIDALKAEAKEFPNTDRQKNLRAAIEHLESSLEK